MRLLERSPGNLRRVPEPGPTSTIAFLVKVSRPGFWLTSVWFYMLPLGQRFVFGSAWFWTGVVFVTLPLGLLLYGVNDLADVETDRLNPRKGTYLFGARGSREQLAALPWQIATAQGLFLVLFAFCFDWLQAALWFAAAFCVTTIYNLPIYGAKNWPAADLLAQSGYLLVFILSSWLNHVPQLPWHSFVFGALFAMHSHLLGQIMDIVPDRAAGRRTTAVTIGIRPAKYLMVGLLAVESWLVIAQSGDLLIGSFLAIAALWFTLDATWLWRDRLYTPWQMRFFLIGWNVAAALSLPMVWQFGRLANHS